MTMPPISDRNGTVIVRWPIACDGPSPGRNGTTEDSACSATPAELDVGASCGMGKVLNFIPRDRPVTVPVDGGSVVPFDTRLADRWDRAVAGIGGIPGVTDDQLRDVFLLMVAEMSGMVASKGGR